MIIKRFFSDTRKYFGYMVNAAKAELKAEVANSYLNWLWWLLEPVCMMFIYAFIFGTVFNAREKYFTAFIFIGISMWNFFSHTLTSSVKMIKSNKSIISKIYLPKYVLLIKSMFVNAFKMFISFIVVIALMIFYKINLSWNIFYIIPVLLILFLFVFGFCTFFLHFGVFVEDLTNVVTICLKLVFYISGIMYNIETRIKGTTGVLMSKYNPMAFLIVSMRKSVLYNIAPSWRWMLAWTVLSLALIYIGVSLIYKNENSYVKAI